MLYEIFVPCYKRTYYYMFCHENCGAIYVKQHISTSKRHPPIPSTDDELVTDSQNESNIYKLNHLNKN